MWQFLTNVVSGLDTGQRALQGTEPKSKTCWSSHRSITNKATLTQQAGLSYCSFISSLEQNKYKIYKFSEKL